MAHEIINPATVHKTTGYSHAARVGGMLYLSGQIAQDVNGDLVGKGDIEEQARQVFRNIEAILKDAGVGMDRIFKMTTLITHPSYLAGFRTARDEFLSEPYPANTLHVVQALAMPQWLIEVEVIADLS